MVALTFFEPSATTNHPLLREMHALMFPHAYMGVDVMQAEQNEKKNIRKTECEKAVRRECSHY